MVEPSLPIHLPADVRRGHRAIEQVYDLAIVGHLHIQDANAVQRTRVVWLTAPRRVESSDVEHDRRLTVDLAPFHHPGIKGPEAGILIV
jgi:hypothetical protein